MSPIISRSNMMLILAAVLVALLAACSSQNSQAIFDPQTGKHPANWLQTHPTSFLNTPSQCTECHGADLHGGTSSVSCFSASFNGMTCHASGPSGHPVGWASPAQHGAAAKAAPNSAAMQGFSNCQLCHANDFTGGFSQTSCMNTAGCHGVGVMSPHPVSWSSGTASTYHHNTTDPGNAPICALCHTAGANSPLGPIPPLAGTAPGCFNSTLCHGAIGHAAGWADPAQHGVAAKKAPNAQNGTGFSICQTCHGSTFAGSGSAVTCLNNAACHGATVNAPHSPTPWRTNGGSARTHTDTDTGNVSVCANCHTLGANLTSVPVPTNLVSGTPGCFNNTLCHGNVGAPHVVPFTNPTLHGPAAKPDLTYCEACHATPSTGGAGSNPRFNVAIGSLTAGCESSGCHAAYTAHPVPWQGLTAGETGHMTAGNMANACALCHGATLNGGVGPACTTCHTAGSPLTMTNCTSCHGNPPNGTSAPNIAGAHAVHMALGTYIVCNTCHTGAGTGTANHDNGTVDVAFQTAYNAKTGSASYTAASFNCSNVSCHGGQTAPNWRTGTIDVNTQCSSCHASGTGQYNSYSSGEHSLHLSSGLPQGAAVCTDCHDTTKLANVHFADLNTTAMTQAWTTILNTRNYTGTGSGTGTCSGFTCHGQTHTNYQW